MSSSGALKADEPVADRRSIQRIYEELDAVYLADDGTEVPCKFLDFSLMGARIAWEREDELPDLFSLYVLAIDMTYEAEVKWRATGHVGVQFTKAHRGRE